MTSRAERLVSGAVTVASPPLVYERLVEVIQHPRSGSADIARVISEDQGLTGRLLKIVNSAFYSFPRRIETVTQAVTVVGTSQIRDLVLATSVMAMFQGVPAGLVDAQSFWFHSLSCGIVARTIAAHRGENNIERFFVGGLLHDIGYLIIFMRAGEDALRAFDVAQETGQPVHECEREILGCDHTQVGNALLHKWNFPPALMDAVRYHHSPRLSSRFPVEAATVHVAEVAVHAMRWGRTGERKVPPFDEAAWQTLGLEPDVVPVVVDEAQRQLGASVDFLFAKA